MHRHDIIEIKARCKDLEAVKACLLEHGARLHGTDHQRDTYFVVESGRLKLREGTIENHLIRYRRPDQAGPKHSDVMLSTHQQGSGLKAILENVLGIWVVVEKQREIYFAENVKLHLDRVQGLGTFLEIEAIDDGHQTLSSLQAQCERWIELLGVTPDDLIEGSYSDLLLAHGGQSDP